MDDPKGWLPDLPPPPGGLAGLRARLDERRSRRRWMPAVVLLAAAVVLAVLVRPRPAAPDVADVGVAAIFALPDEPVTVPPGAEERVAVARVEAPVVWYRVAGTAVVGEVGAAP